MPWRSRETSFEGAAQATLASWHLSGGSDALPQPTPALERRPALAAGAPWFQPGANDATSCMCKSLNPQKKIKPQIDFYKTAVETYMQAFRMTFLGCIHTEVLPHP